MAIKEQKNKLNIQGKLFCTSPDAEEDWCTSCGLCYSTAPEYFESDDQGAGYVYNQPEEIDDFILEVIEDCPNESIGVE